MRRSWDSVLRKALDGNKELQEATQSLAFSTA